MNFLFYNKRLNENKQIIYSCIELDSKFENNENFQGKGYLMRNGIAHNLENLIIDCNDYLNTIVMNTRNERFYYGKNKKNGFLINTKIEYKNGNTIINEEGIKQLSY